MVEGKDHLQQVVLWTPHMYTYIRTQKDEQM